VNIPLSPIRCLYRAIDLYGHKLAVVSGSNRYSYEEFGERCARMSAGLVNAGVQPGNRVGFLSFNNGALLTAYFAVPAIRAVLMPLNVRLQKEELLSILDHSRPRVLLYEREFEPIVETLRPANRFGCRYIRIGEESFPTDPDWDELMETCPHRRTDLFDLDENSPAELFYTSGSTGHPKGALLSHRTLYLHALSLAGSLDHSDDHVMLHTIPLFHANGWGFPHFATMCGMRHVMVRRFDPEVVLGLIQEEQATRMILVPTMANTLVNFSDRSKFDLSSMREIIVGGAAASPGLIATLRTVFDCTVFVGYGLTESGPVVSMARPKWSPKEQDPNTRLQNAASAGWPVLGIEAKVVDAHGEDVPHDGRTVGEIIVRGDNIMDGYYLDEEHTTGAFTQGWLHSGDMAVWDADSWLRIVDRKKDIIVSGGENISSIEIEHAILLHPAVLECAVVSAPHAHWGEMPAAIIVLRKNQQLTQDQLIDFLSKQIAKYKLPRIVRFSETPLPKTGTGKVMKLALREPYWEDYQNRVQTKGHAKSS
jgi:fatty-acyl-CoA synthase